ncbi:MAG TPA: GvpL/GvpF family gas vesicle protein [Ktedonobacterales bacterium]
MNDQRDHDHTIAPAAAEGGPDASGAARGWYLYGIIQCEHDTDISLPLPDTDTSAGSATSEPARLLREGDLAAIVRMVTLVPAEDGKLGMGLRTAQQLETMVLEHNDLIAAVHRQRTILPSKFGCVYTQEDDLRHALRQQQESLLDQLHRLRNCDEWGVHIYAQPSLVRERLARNDPRVRHVEDELATATPGKAYMLKRQLANLLVEVTGQSLADLAHVALDALARHAADVSVAGQPRQAAKLDEEIEILRASFLVGRPESTSFLDAIQRFTAGNEGLRCEYSGPWPPYSFVGSLEESAS